MKLGVKIALGVAGAFAVLQLVPVERTNPPVTAEIKAPDDVKAILKRACWDCHSNETVWPWYSRVAPVSFLVRHDVVDGRKHLNFSEWGTYKPERKEKKQKECGEEVSEGEMPLAIYVPLHPEAKLSQADKQAIEDWAKGPVSE
ncbi:MAG: heme-binding domain-containing protein [Myxococcota bacterium]|jgi:cytochrome c551/c552